MKRQKESLADLEADLQGWDGKSADDIRTVYERHRNSAAFAPDVVASLQNKKTELGASWLLKHYFASGGTVTNRISHTICQSADALSHWAARLHLLQCLPFLYIAPEHKNTLESFVRRGLSDEHAFVRAWSYNGLNVLANRFPDLRNETRLIFEMALRDEAASVKARIRNILKNDR